VADAVVADVVHLELMGHGKDDVRHGGGGRHEEVGNGHEFELPECLIGLFTVRPGHQGVGAHGVVAPDGIGDILEDRPAEEGGRDGHEPGDDPVMAADHLLGLVGNKVRPDKLPQTHDLGLIGIDVASRHLEVPADRHKT